MGERLVAELALRESFGEESGEEEGAGEGEGEGEGVMFEDDWKDVNEEKKKVLTTKEVSKMRKRERLKRRVEMWLRRGGE